MWQFREAVRGLADICRELETPVVSGNVSLYNETDGKAIYPTPSVAMIGLIPDLAAQPVVTQAFQGEGDQIVLVGLTTDELGGSEYLEVVHGKIAGKVPALDVALELTVERLVIAGIRAGLVKSAHDLSEGGFFAALAECCVSGPRPIGARASTTTPLRADHWLFAESPSRILVSVAPGNLQALAELAADLGAPITHLGQTGGDRLTVSLGPGQGKLAPVLDLPLSEISRVWREGFRKVAE
jgi:phosphoribosylformylglycinamidine synthase